MPDGTAPIPSRRRFLTHGLALAGAAATGLSLPGPGRADFWGCLSVLAAAEGFCSAMSWYISAITRRAFTLTVADVTRTDSPQPTGSEYHNRFAPHWIVSNTLLHFRPEDSSKEKQPISLDGFLRPYEVNQTELDQLKLEQKAGRFSSVLVPVTRRYPVDLTRHGVLLQKVAAGYGLRPGDYRAEYRNVWSDDAGTEYLGFGVKTGAKLRFLLARVRRA